MIFRAARPWFSRAAAGAAGVIAAIYLPSIYYGGLILKTWMTVFLVTLLLWLISRALLRGVAARDWFLAGIVLGLACLTRGNLILLLPVLALWVFIESPPGQGRRAGAVAAAWLAAGTLLAIAPATLHNRVAGGEWILATANAGQNLFIGNNPLNRTGEYTALPFVDPNPKHEERDFAAEARRRSGKELTASAVSRYWFDRALEWIGDDPAGWVSLLGRKLHAYWAAYEIPDNLDYYLYRESAPVLRLPIPGFGLVAPLGLLGAVLVWRRPGWPRMLLLLVVAYSASVVLFFVFSRFRMAMMPALFVLAGHAVVELARRAREAVRDGGYRPLLRAAVLLLLLAAAVNVPLRCREGSWTCRLAGAAGLPARVESSATGHFNLGVAYAASPSTLGLAETHLREAVRQDPRFAEVHVELGKVLARQGRNREAIAVYLDAERAEPENYLVQHALGLLYRRVGDLAEAERRFRRALGAAPNHAASATRLGEVLLESGRPAEAVTAFSQALRLAPSSAAARRGLEQARSSAP